ncbi:MAG: hypothetical protein L6E13_12970 [Firmicutes bacterium]|nr:hypothetical protein [Bacillota bacterium]
MRPVLGLLAFLGTFLLVYGVGPWVGTWLLHRFPIEHPERYYLAVTFISAVVVYNLLRWQFGERLPRV